VIGDAVFLDQTQKIHGRIAGQRGLRKVDIGGEEIFRSRMQVCEIAAASARDQNFLANSIGAF
jgi:hypothetical protein